MQATSAFEMCFGPSTRHSGIYYPGSFLKERVVWGPRGANTGIGSGIFMLDSRCVLLSVSSTFGARSSRSQSNPVSNQDSVIKQVNTTFYLWLLFGFLAFWLFGRPRQPYHLDCARQAAAAAARPQHPHTDSRESVLSAQVGVSSPRAQRHHRATAVDFALLAKVDSFWCQLQSTPNASAVRLHAVQGLDTAHLGTWILLQTFTSKSLPEGLFNYFNDLVVNAS